MDHIAIDLGGRESQVCIRTEDGTIVDEDRRPTSGLGKYLARRARSRVVLESCAEAFAVADGALTAGHEVVVVPSSLVRALGVGQRGLKSDVRDARNLSEASCRMKKLPSVHIPAEASRQRKALCSSRESLISSRTMLVNSVRGWVRTLGVGGVQGGTPKTLPPRLRKHLEDRTGNPVPSYIERQLLVIDELNRQLHESDRELAELAQEDVLCRRLMTVPGVGPVTSVRFAAALDDVSRFDNAHSVEAYLGLTPGENSSSERKRITGITKAGPAQVRRTLIQAAWSAFRTRPHHPMVLWATEVAKRRGRKVAIVALSRKMAGILFAMWRDGSEYRPQLASTPLTQDAPAMTQAT